MNHPSFSQVLGGVTVAVNGELHGFALKKQASSLVDYFGINHADNHLFMQFNNGNCTMYKNVPKEVLDMAAEAPSIGKFYHGFIKGKYEYDDLGSRWVTPVTDDEDDDEDWDSDEDLFAEGIEE